MKQMKVLGVIAIALTLGLTACGGSKKEECKKHTWVAGEVIKAATCTEKGQQKQKCSVCGKEETKELAMLPHTYEQVDGADKVTWTSRADCTNPGAGTKVCTVCGTVSNVTESALGHTWADAADQTGAVAATCTEAGTKIQECSRCHVKEPVTVDALGHDFPENGRALDVPAESEKNVFGEDTIWAHITNYSCTRGDSFRYAWSAKEVNFDYAHEGVHFTQEEIDAAGEDETNPAYGKTTNDWKVEPNLVDSGEDGIRFWGRPIGNAMVLSADGTDSSRGSAEKVPDESVPGSRFEFDFVFDQDLTGVCLSAELTPAQYTGDIFKNGAGVEEWTPGYRFVDDDNDPNTPKVPQMIETFRYIIYLDGVEVPLDASVSVRGSQRGWYQFPCKLNLSAGKHNLNIAMAGGYLHTFYNFSFEKVVSHEHNFQVSAKAADSALRPMTCQCGASGYELQAADCTTGQKSPVSTNKDTRLGKGGITDDVWNITGIGAGQYDVYLDAQNSNGNDDAWWNAGTAQDNGDTAGNNGNGSRDYRYKITVDSGTAVNVGGNTAADTYSAYGLSYASRAVTNKPVARITVANGAASLTLHNMENGYAIWVYGMRLVAVAA